MYMGDQPKAPMTYMRPPLPLPSQVGGRAARPVFQPYGVVLEYRDMIAVPRGARDEAVWTMHSASSLSASDRRKGHQTSWGKDYQIDCADGTSATRALSRPAQLGFSCWRSRPRPSLTGANLACALSALLKVPHPLSSPVRHPKHPTAEYSDPSCIAISQITASFCGLRAYWMRQTMDLFGGKPAPLCNQE
ncbi:hypothetical protein BX600DRAFT_429306 [Xylariales sp. PMI_506]|nr:hypothetical protein BX600DRAFT_429306 [Xylariales sp. PMI_506]